MYASINGKESIDSPAKVTISQKSITNVKILFNHLSSNLKSETDVYILKIYLMPKLYKY